MANTDPSVFDEGHGPLSSVDEKTGGLAGATLGATVGYERAGVPGAVAGGLAGWTIGEAVTDLGESTPE